MPALSSGVADFYAIVCGAAHGLQTHAAESSNWPSWEYVYFYLRHISTADIVGDSIVAHGENRHL